MWIYDIEVLGGNFFSATFKHVKTKEIVICYKLNEREYNIDKLYSLIKDGFLIGYNNSKYDDIMLNCIWKNRRVDTWHLYELSTEIIHNQTKGVPLWKNPMLKPYTWGEIQSIDLMKILAFDKLKVPLKQCAVNLRYPLIKDLIRPPDLPVKEEDVEAIIKYNINDVEISDVLYQHIKELLNLRYKITKDYKVDVLNASKTYIGKAILNRYYSEYTGLDKFEFEESRTNRAIIELKDCISPKINFQTDTFKDILNHFNSISTRIDNKSKDDKTVDYIVRCNGKGYQMGFGGLHSIDRPAKYYTTDDYVILDADVDSYYPRVMINERIKPRHVNDEFFDVLIDITDRRLEAKQKKDMITADTLKITINSIFGLLNFPNYWLYDPLAAYSVTISGQLFLLMLIEKLEMNGIEVISANTDGVTSKVHVDDVEKYYKLCDDWCKETNFNLSFSKYMAYIRKDVNNYLVVKDNGETKEKGCFLMHQELEKGYNTSIIPQALYNYFVKGVPVKETIKSGTNIFDYCLSQKIGGQFTPELHCIEEDNKVIHKLQKTNRYFISKRGGTFIKRKKDDSTYNLQVGWQIILLNDYDKDKVNEYLSLVDHRYYISKCTEIIESIEDKQLKLY